MKAVVAPRLPVLLLIDVQEAFRQDREAGFAWGNPEAETRIAALLAGFRAAGAPVIHVHHHGTDPRDNFHPEASGAQAMDIATPLPSEPVIVKRGASAFIGTDLAERLAALGHPPLVIAGGAANYCVESTARMAGNLGHDTSIAGDALINFQKTLHDGRIIAAPDVLAYVLATLDGEFARVADSATLLAELTP